MRRSRERRPVPSEHARQGLRASRRVSAGGIKYWIGRAWLGVFGWRVETEEPPPSFVFVAAPHTSGWDLPFMLACSYVMRVPVSWMGKRELFRPPFGWFMRALGGI